MSARTGNEAKSSSRAPADTHRGHVVSRVKRRPLVLFAAASVIAIYLTYAWFEFNVSRLIDNAKPERVALLARDAVAYKVHITKLLRRDRLTISIEGERTAEYESPPEWIERTGNNAYVNLSD